jgi:hypothetical protein
VPRPAHGTNAFGLTGAPNGSRNSGPSASGCPMQGAQHQTAAHRCGNPDQPGLAVAPVRLARLPDDCSAGNRHPLAPGGLAPVLAPQSALRSPSNSRRASSAHSAHGERESDLRSRAHRQRIAAQARPVGFAVPFASTCRSRCQAARAAINNGPVSSETTPKPSSLATSSWRSQRPSGRSTFLS